MKIPGNKFLFVSTSFHQFQKLIEMYRNSLKLIVVRGKNLRQLKFSAGFTPLEVLGRKILEIFRPHRDVSWYIIEPPCGKIAFLKNRRLLTGFTLLEIVISIAILILIASAASVSFSNSRNVRELTTASQNVLSILRTTQSKTLAGEENSQWGVHIEQTQVILFRGATYAGAGFTEAYPLPSTIEIANVALLGSGSDVIFKRIEGTTDETGTFELRVKSDTTKTFSVTVESSGKVYQTGTAPTPTGTRLTDARHRAFALGWSIQSSITTTITFEDPPYPNTISTIPMASYFDAGKTKFDWSGAVAVGTTTQILRIHTTSLSATDAVLHVDRDCRRNTKKMRIDIDAKYIATYEVDCKTVTVGNFGGTISEP